ncbi:uncharacterized protein [Asterias amurensis]|uniref:uncharacterized protein n=1 Tax=Asterias amurensis TaxID=7602 RepID=UPI003AB3CA3F
METEESLGGTTTLKRRKSSTTQPPTTTTLEPLVTLPTGGNAIGTIGVDQVTTKDTTFMFTTAEPVTTTLTTVVTTVPTTATSPTTTQETTTTTTTASTTTEMTTTSTTTVTTTTTQTPVTKENCADELGAYEQPRTESDGSTPLTRMLIVPFTSPVTLTGVQLQGDTAGNAITSFTMSYKLFGDDSPKEVLNKKSGEVQVFDVPFDDDLTQKVTVPLPFNQLDNVIEVILSNINVPSDKQASFIVDFEGCAKPVTVIPTTTKEVTTTVSTTTPEKIETTKRTTTTTTTTPETTTTSAPTTTTIVTTPEGTTTTESTTTATTVAPTTAEYCVEEEKGSEKSRQTSPEGGEETSLINNDSQWSFTIPTTNTPRRERPSITVDFETPVKLVGVVLQGAPQENGELRFVVSIQTEDNGNFDKIVGSSKGTSALLDGDTVNSLLFENSDIPREVRAARLEVIDLSNPSKSTGTLRLSFKSCQEGVVTEKTTTVVTTTTVPATTVAPTTTTTAPTTTTMAPTTTTAAPTTTTAAPTTTTLAPTTTTVAATTAEYCVEEEKGSEKSRKTSPEGGKETSLINSDSQWSFTIPTTNTPRRDRPSVTVNFETPVKLVGVDLQGAPQENGELRFVVSIQTEDNGNFDKIVGNSEGTSALLDEDTVNSLLFETSDIPREVRAARLEVIDLSNPSKSTGTLRLAFKSCQEVAPTTTTMAPTTTTMVPTTSKATTTTTVRTTLASTTTVEETTAVITTTPLITTSTSEPTTTEVTTKRITTTPSTTTAPTTEQTTTIKVTTTPEATITEKIVMETEESLGGTTTLKHRKSSTTQPPTTTTLEPLVTLPTGGNAIGTIGVDQVTATDTNFMFTTAKPVTTSLTTVVTTVPTTATSPTTTKETTTTTTTTASTAAETTTTSTTTVTTTTTPTPVTKENCADELGAYEQPRTESDGSTPLTRMLVVPFTSPVTLTGIQLQGDTAGNAITSFTMSYKLFGDDSSKKVNNEKSGKVQVFDVPFSADFTQKVTVPLPFNQLDNVIEVILSNINVPSDKKASFTVDFEGCAKPVTVIPTTTKEVTTTVSTTTPEKIETTKVATTTTTTPETTTTSAPTTTTIVTTPEGTTTTESTTLTTVAPTTAGKPATTEVTTKRITTTPSTTTAPTTEQTTTIKVTTTPEATITEKIVMETVQSQRGTTTLKQRQSPTTQPPTTTTFEPLVTLPTGGNAIGTIGVDQVTATDTSFMFTRSSTTQPPTTTTLEPLVTLPTGGNAIGTIGVDQVTATDTNFMFTTAEPVTTTLTTVVTTVPTTATSPTTTKETTTTTTTASTTTEMTTTSTTTVTTTTTPTPVTKGNCADELTKYQEGTSELDGQSPQARAYQARFSTPVTVTGVQLQGDSDGNAITSYTLRYKLYGEDAEKQFVDSSGVEQVFTVLLGVDITQKVTVPVNPQLDNVEKVTLLNINVLGKKASFKVEFEGCAKPSVIPTTTKEVTTTVSTTTPEKIETTKVATTTTTTPETTTTSAPTTTTIVTTPEGTTTTESTTITTVAPTTAGKPATTEVTTKRITTTPSLTTAPTTEQTTTIKATTTPEATITEKIVMETERSQGGTTTLKQRQSSTTQPPTTTTLEPLVTLPTGGNAIGTIGVDQVTATDTNFMFTTAEPVTTTLTTVVTTVPTTATSPTTTKETTTTTTTASTTTEMTTTSTTTVTTTTTPTPVTKGNCADELTKYQEGTSELDGQSPQARAYQARFSTPVTVTGVQLQGDSDGNAITSYTLRYKLYGEDAEKQFVDSSGVEQVFTVLLGVDITQKVTVPVNPQLDNVEKVTLLNINVLGKKASFKVEFEGCAKPSVIPTTTKEVTTTVSTTTPEKIETTKVATTTTTTPETTTTSAPTTTTIVTTPEGTTTTESTTITTVAPTTAGKPATTEVTTKRITTTPSTTTAPTTEQTTTIKVTTTPEATITEKIVMETGQSQRGTTTLKQRQSPTTQPPTTTTLEPLVTLPTGGNAIGTIGVDQVTATDTSFMFTRSSTTQPPTTTTLEPLVTLPTGGNAIGTIGVDQVTATDTSFMFTTAEPVTTTLTTVVTTVPTTATSPTTTKETTTTTTTASTTTEMTTTSTTTVTTTTTPTPVTKGNCADELTKYQEGTSELNGQSPQARAYQARFSTPVTVTGVQLQGDSDGNAITSYTLRYKLYGEDAEKEFVDSSGVEQVFTVPLGVDITQKLTVPVSPQLDNVEKVTLLNINVPLGKKASFQVEFEGCAKPGAVTPTTTKEVTTTVSTTTPEKIETTKVATTTTTTPETTTTSAPTTTTIVTTPEGTTTTTVTKTAAGTTKEKTTLVTTTTVSPSTTTEAETITTVSMGEASTTTVAETSTSTSTTPSTTTQEYCAEPLVGLEKNRIGSPITVLESTKFNDEASLEFDNVQLNAIVFFTAPVRINELKLQSRGIKDFTLYAGTSSIKQVTDETGQLKVFKVEGSADEVTKIRMPTVEVLEGVKLARLTFTTDLSNGDKALLKFEFLGCQSEEPAKTEATTTQKVTVEVPLTTKSTTTEKTTTTPTTTETETVTDSLITEHVQVVTSTTVMSRGQPTTTTTELPIWIIPGGGANGTVGVGEVTSGETSFLFTTAKSGTTTTTTEFPIFVFPGGGANGNIEVTEVTSDGSSFIFSTVKPGTTTTTTELPIFLLPNGGANGNIEVGEVTSNGTSFIFTQAPTAQTAKRTTVTETVPKTAGAKTTKVTTTTTTTAGPTTTTKSTTTTTTTPTPVTKENCVVLLTPSFEGSRSIVNGNTAEGRSLMVPFLTPVTLTRVALQGDAEGNAITDFTVQYRLKGETTQRSILDGFNKRVFNVNWDVDTTEQIKLDLPFDQLENVVEVTLMDVNVPDNKEAKYVVDFYGCADEPLTTPATTTTVSTSTSTTEALTTTTLESSKTTTTTPEATTAKIIKQTIKRVTEPEKVCDMELETYDNVALLRSTPEGTLEANVPWRPSSAANTNERRLEIKFTPPIAVRSLIAEQDEDFEFILFYRSPGATYDTYVRSANNQLMRFKGGSDGERQELPDYLGEIETLKFMYMSYIADDETPEIDIKLFGCFDHVTTTAVTTTVKTTTPTATTTEKVTESTTVTKTETTKGVVTEEVQVTERPGVFTTKETVTLTTLEPVSTTLGICTENLETSPAMTGIFVERMTSEPDNGLSGFQSPEYWMPSIEDNVIPYVNLKSNRPFSLKAFMMAGAGQGNGITNFRFRYQPFGSTAWKYYLGSDGQPKEFTGSLAAESTKPVWVFLSEATEAVGAVTVELLQLTGSQPALKLDFFGCSSKASPTTRQTTIERIVTEAGVTETVTESFNNVITNTESRTTPSSGSITTPETPVTPHIGVTTAGTGVIIPIGETDSNEPTEVPTEDRGRGCMYNGRQYQFGEEMPSTSPCTRMFCEQGSGIVDYTEECDLRCDGKLRYIEEKCCPVCEKESKMCLRESKLEKLILPDGCVSTDLVEFTYCNGGCPSRSYIDMIAGQSQLRSECRCCKPASMVDRSVTLDCNNNVRKTYNYKIINECSCEICKFDEPYGGR